MAEKFQSEIVEIPGVRKSGWLKITLIVVACLAAAFVAFNLLNIHFGWIAIYPF